MRVGMLRKSFVYAWKGLTLVFRTEQNFRIQIVVGIIVLGVGYFLYLPAWKMITLLLVTGFVLVLELVNSLFERLLDAFRPRIHHYIEEMKDIMAAAVLIASIGAVIIGLILFWPHLALVARAVVR